jgi:hypothetical protein
VHKLLLVLIQKDKLMVLVNVIQVMRKVSLPVKVLPWENVGQNVNLLINMTQGIVNNGVLIQ